jgi:hypothetical protein
VIAHVLVDQASRYEHSLVLRQLLEDITETLQGLVELVGPVVHETQVESAADEVLRKCQSLLVHVD